jgi:hypothetical protein
METLGVVELEAHAFGDNSATTRDQQSSLYLQEATPRADRSGGTFS